MVKKIAAACALLSVPLIALAGVGEGWLEGANLLAAKASETCWHPLPIMVEIDYTVRSCTYSFFYFSILGSSVIAVVAGAIWFFWTSLMKRRKEIRDERKKPKIDPV